MGKTYRYNPDNHQYGRRQYKFYRSRAGSAKHGVLDSYDDVGNKGPRELARRQQRRQLKQMIRSEELDGGA